MLANIQSLDNLETAITHATAPAFLLGAVAGFLSILVSRLERVVDRVRARRTATIAATDEELNARVSEALTRRMKLLSHAIFLAVLSALCTASLLIFAFLCAIFNFGHNTGLALMFMAALALLIASLIELARELRVSMRILNMD
jgi:hypothetical protein